MAYTVEALPNGYTRIYCRRSQTACLVYADGSRRHGDLHIPTLLARRLMGVTS